MRQVFQLLGLSSAGACELPGFGALRLQVPTLVRVPGPCGIGTVGCRNSCVWRRGFMVSEFEVQVCSKFRLLGGSYI
eukprot:15457949-Alexandrium_andersonii.AAC.1